jgi:hypothetical protein
MAPPSPDGISRSLLRRELDELQAYMERALFFFHVAPALVRNDEKPQARDPRLQTPERGTRPAIDRRALPATKNLAAASPQGIRGWLPAFF